MATKGKRPMRALTPGDKIEAIQRVNDGESKASVARDIGVPESTLRGWCKNEDKLRYMTSRLSSPDTDKSNDGEPLDKRARTESPAAPPAPPAPPSPTAGLDLSSAAAPPAPAPAPPPPPPPPADAPVELTTRRAQPSPPAPLPRERRADPGVSASMSAISPLSGLAHLPGLAHSHLGLSFNEIATNLTLLAQLNPSLAGLTAQPASRALRSVRSPKPAHNGLGHGDTKHRSKHHSSDPYRHSAKASHLGVGVPPASQPVDDTLWYWLKTQQAMLDLTAQAPAAHPLHLAKPAEPTPPPKPVAPAPPLAPHLDYNRNSWLWQYYKQFGGAMPLPDDKMKPATQGPRDKAAENILYSHLTKTKGEEERAACGAPTGPARAHAPPEPAASHATSHAASHAASHTTHDTATSDKEPSAERSADASRSHTKARTVLDSLLFNGSAEADSGALGGACAAGAAGAAEALAHGEQFLAWLEGSAHPAVTRVHVHQLRALLQNLRARRGPAPPAPAAAAAAAK